MCGIAGYVRFDSLPADQAVIKKMTDALAHRGPNAEGFFVKNSIALGHRRLSIIDLSETANQPFVDASGYLRVTFNGELYNFKEVKATFPSHLFRTNSDTEVLAEAYARSGIDCIKLFKGMFAFGIWDEKQKELCIARDRMGVKPLYYYCNDSVFIFASEIRALLASGLVPPKIDKEAVAEFLTYQSISAPISIIEGIHQLEAGHYLKVRNGKVEIQSYWNIVGQGHEYDFSQRKVVTATIKNLLLKSVEGRLISDVPIGAFLSGGIDSSAVVALMAAVSSNRPNTFTVSFSEKEFDESVYAGLVANKYNAYHHKILLKPTVMVDELENALNAMDSPSGDGINTYVVSKAVRQQGLTVALSGIGGDELFAGYPIFKSFTRMQHFRHILEGPAWLKKPVSILAGLSASRSSMKMMQLLQAENASIENIYPIFRKIQSSAGLRRLTNLDIKDHTIIEQKLRYQSQALHNYPLLSQISIAEFMGYTQQTLLKDTDQMGMAVSLEIREPFFDHELVAYVLNIPDKLKFPSYPKQLLVESLGDLLPAEIVHRKKQGFTFPWKIWMKKELRSFCECRINDFSERDFINREAVKSLWHSFLKNDPKVRWMEIWLMVVLEYWLAKNNID